jgi:hypothetical protein
MFLFFFCNLETEYNKNKTKLHYLPKAITIYNKCPSSNDVDFLHEYSTVYRVWIEGVKIIDPTGKRNTSNACKYLSIWEI